jgi:hypothetical protein
MRERGRRREEDFGKEGWNKKRERERLRQRRVKQVRGLQAVAPMDDPKRGKRENYGLVGLAPVANGHQMVILDLI